MQQHIIYFTRDGVVLPFDANFPKGGSVGYVSYRAVTGVFTGVCSTSGSSVQVQNLPRTSVRLVKILKTLPRWTSVRSVRHSKPYRELPRSVQYPEPGRVRGTACRTLLWTSVSAPQRQTTCSALPFIWWQAALFTRSTTSSAVYLSGYSAATSGTHMSGHDTVVQYTKLAMQANPPRYLELSWLPWVRIRDKHLHRKRNTP